jgi:integrase
MQLQLFVITLIDAINFGCFCVLKLLGHKSSKTTEIYTHFSTREIQKIKSPFDDL